MYVCMCVCVCMYVGAYVCMCRVNSFDTMFDIVGKSIKMKSLYLIICQSTCANAPGNENLCASKVV